MRLIAALLLLLSSFAGAAESRVMILGTWHFSNPGEDLHNVDSVDVLEVGPQAELERLVKALAAFEPEQVFVEWPDELANERYAKYLKGTLEPSRDEVVQIGFRLAALRGLKRVYGIDVAGDFPFEAVTNWAAANGQAARIEALMAQAAEIVARSAQVQRESGIAATLRDMNDPQRIAREHSMFYADMLRLGKGDDQPGVELHAAWFKRNAGICARLLQSMPADGTRAVVLFGQGHAHWLRRCVTEAQGVELVEPSDWLP